MSTALHGWERSIAPFLLLLHPQNIVCNVYATLIILSDVCLIAPFIQHGALGITHTVFSLDLVSSTGNGFRRDEHVTFLVVLDFNQPKGHRCDTELLHGV